MSTISSQLKDNFMCAPSSETPIFLVPCKLVGKVSIQIVTNFIRINEIILGLALAALSYSVGFLTRSMTLKNLGEKSYNYAIAAFNGHTCIASSKEEPKQTTLSTPLVSTPSAPSISVPAESIREKPISFLDKTKQFCLDHKFIIIGGLIAISAIAYLHFSQTVQTDTVPNTSIPIGESNPDTNSTFLPKNLSIPLLTNETNSEPTDFCPTRSNTTNLFDTSPIVSPNNILNGKSNFLPSNIDFSTRVTAPLSTRDITIYTPTEQPSDSFPNDGYFKEIFSNLDSTDFYLHPNKKFSANIFQKLQITDPSGYSIHCSPVQEILDVVSQNLDNNANSNALSFGSKDPSSELVCLIRDSRITSLSTDVSSTTSPILTSPDLSFINLPSPTFNGVSSTNFLIPKSPGNSLTSNINKVFFLTIGNKNPSSALRYLMSDVFSLNYETKSFPVSEIIPSLSSSFSSIESSTFYSFQNKDSSNLENTGYTSDIPKVARNNLPTSQFPLAIRSLSKSLIPLPYEEQNFEFIPKCDLTTKRFSSRIACDFTCNNIASLLLDQNRNEPHVILNKDIRTPCYLPSTNRLKPSTPIPTYFHKETPV